MPDATPSTARRVSTDEDVDALVGEILDPARVLPVIVVTTKPSADGPFVDADALAGRVGEGAAVWVLTEPDLAWALTDELPPKIDVYGGAVRAYTPIAEGDEPYPSDHPQWTAFNTDEGEKVLELIVNWVQLTASNPLPEFGSTATATVTMVRKAGAELDLSTGHPAFASIGHMIQHGEVFHAADVVQVGQEVTVRVGPWHPQAGRVSVSLREFAPDPWQRLAEVYKPGDLIEGGVSGVTAFGAFVELLPGVEGLLHKSKIADEFVEYVDDYVQEGDRITVRLLDLDPRERKAGVSLREVPRGAKPVPPASIFPGGPPWLPEPSAIASAATEADTAEGGSWTEIKGDPRAREDGERAPTASAAPAPSAAPTDELPDPGYGDELSIFVELILEHGAGEDAALADLLRDALERAVTTFDARLDESDESSDDPGEPLVSLRNAAADLIDALRVDDDADVGEPSDDAGEQAADAPTDDPGDASVTDVADTE